MKSESSRSSLMAIRADKLLSAAAATTAAAVGSGVVGDTNSADAAIVYSGVVNIAVPNNIDGVYLNVVTGASGSTAVAGYDINPYSASAVDFNLWGPTASTWLFTGPAATPQYALPTGTVVGAAGTYGRPGGTTVVTPQVVLNADNYFGFRFTNESTSATNFGWVKFAFGSSIGSRTITGYAYENAGASIQIGQTAVPEPTSLALLATGAAGLIAARRRRQKVAA